MKNKILIGLIAFLVIAIIAVAGVLVYLTTQSNSNNVNLQNSMANNEQEEIAQNAETQSQNIITENTTTQNSVTENVIAENTIAQNNVATENTVPNNTANNNKKILIAFFSRADENYNVGTVSVGNTEMMARYIKEYLGDRADGFKIDPVVSYPTNYKECTEVATREKNSNARPEFKNAEALDLSKYDTILLGYPIWWGDVPMIINTFLEKYDFSGKTIIPFNTHEGSGDAGTYENIKNKMTSSNVNTNGLSIRGAIAREESSKSTVENWLKGLGL